MSAKSKGQTSRGSRSASKRRGQRGRRSSRGADPLVWIAAVPLTIISLLVFSAWQSGAFARAPRPSRAGDPANLLPLADAGDPLRGGHDMALIPQLTPTPQAAPLDVPVPRLDISSASYDFGRVYRQWDVTHIFAIQNVGDADLLISNLVTSCGCTVAELSSSVIAPGQRADLTVTFDADFHETSGEVTRLVWFSTNDTTQPWVEVRITAEVR